MTRKKKDQPAPPRPPQAGFVELGADAFLDRLSLFKAILTKDAHRKDLLSYHVTLRADGTATVAGRNMVDRLQLKLDVLDCEGSGTVNLDVAALDTMLAAYYETRLRVHFDHRTEVRVTGPGVTMTLPGYDAHDQTSFHTAEGSLTATGWRFAGYLLAGAIERTRFAVFAGDETKTQRPALAGLAFALPEPGADRAEAVAADGWMVALARLPVIRIGDDPPRVWRPEWLDGVPALPVLPRRLIPLVLKIAKEAEGHPIGLAVIPGDPGLIQVLTRTLVLTTEVVAGQYPAYRPLWPDSPARGELQVDDARRLKHRVITAAAATDDDHRGVELVLADGSLMLSAQGKATGKVILTLAVPGSTGRFTVELDAGRLRKFLIAAGSEPLVMRFYRPGRVAVTFAAGSDHEFLIMPMASSAGPEPEPAPKPKQEPEPEPEPKAEFLTEAEFEDEIKAEIEDELDGDVGNNPVVPPAESRLAVPGDGKAKPTRRKRK